MTRAERLAAAGSVTTAAGVGLSLIASVGLGGLLAVLGLLTTAVALHRLGRQGPEQSNAVSGE